MLSLDLGDEPVVKDKFHYDDEGAQDFDECKCNATPDSEHWEDVLSERVDYILEQNEY